MKQNTTIFNQGNTFRMLSEKNSNHFVSASMCQLNSICWHNMASNNLANIGSSMYQTITNIPQGSIPWWGIAIPNPMPTLCQMNPYEQTSVNFIWNPEVFIEINAFENAICTLSAILSWPCHLFILPAIIMRTAEQTSTRDRKISLLFMQQFSQIM